MANSSKKTSKSKGKGKAEGKTESFVWSDDEVELLLKVTQEYKVSQTSVKTDWESFENSRSILRLLLYPLQNSPTMRQCAQDAYKIFELLAGFA